MTLFSVSQVPTGNLFEWMPSADGETFYLVRAGEREPRADHPITVILNVNAELAGK